MGQHHPFGDASGAGRVNQCADAVCTIRLDRLRFDFFVQRPDADWAHIRDLPNGRAMPFGMLRCMRRKARSVDHKAGTAMIADLINFTGRQTCTHKHWPGIDAGQG